MTVKAIEPDTQACSFCDVAVRWLNDREQLCERGSLGTVERVCLLQGCLPGRTQRNSVGNNRQGCQPLEDAPAPASPSGVRASPSASHSGEGGTVWGGWRRGWVLGQIPVLAFGLSW